MAIGGLQDDIHGHLVMAMAPNQKVGCVQNLTIGAAAVQSANFTAINPYNRSTGAGVTNTGSIGTTHIRLCASADCFIMVGTAPFTLTATNGLFLPAGVPEYFPVDVLDFVWVIQSAGSSGNLNIVECE